MMFAVAGGGVLVGFLLFAIVVAVAWPWLAPSDPSVVEGDAPEVSVPSAPPVAPPPVAGPVIPPPLSDEQRARIAVRTTPSLATITVESTDGKRAASGFLIDSRGWVAAPFQLLKNADRATVQLPGLEPATWEAGESGAMFGDEGYSCALFRVAKPGAPNLGIPLSIFDPLKPNDPLVIAGNSRGVGGLLPARMVAIARLDQLLEASDLTEASKDRLLMMTRNDDLTFIKFSQPVTPAMAGLPLLNPGGAAVGMAVDLGPELTHGYAIHLKHLAPLIDELNSAPATESAAPPATTVEVTPPAVTDPPLPGAPVVADTPADPEEAPVILPPEPKVDAPSITLWTKATKQMKWTARTEEDYLPFAQLARIVTQAKRQAEDEKLDLTYRELAAIKADDVVHGELKKTPWPEREDVETMNEVAFAVARSARKETGVFLRARFIDQQRPRRDAFDGRSLLLFQLIGLNEYVALPVKTSDDRLVPNSQWLILGDKITDAGIALSFNDGVATNEVRLLVEAIHIVEKPKVVVE